MKTTFYFQSNVTIRRPYLKLEWIENILKNPIRIETQANGRVRFWGFVPEHRKYLRVVTEPDRETIHNAFFDRRFKIEEK